VVAVLRSVIPAVVVHLLVVAVLRSAIPAVVVHLLVDLSEQLNHQRMLPLSSKGKQGQMLQVSVIVFFCAY